MSKCEQCIYYPKCDEYPFDESGCKDFKDRNNFVELPCKVGDTVWVVFSNGIRPYVVDRIYIMGNSGIMVRMRFMLNEILRLTGENFGKTVFLTREEAEAALEKMGGAKNG